MTMPGSAQTESRQCGRWSGATAIFVELPSGEYEIGGDKIVIVECGMGARHFVSRATGHRLVNGFEPKDFCFWYDPAERRVTPILYTTFNAQAGKLYLRAEMEAGKATGPSLAAAEKRCGRGSLLVCQISLAGRLSCNPAAMLFADRLTGES